MAAPRPHSPSKHLVFHTRIRTAVENARNELPGARGRKRVSVAIEGAQQLRPKADESNDLRPNPAPMARSDHSSESTSESR
jgi:hypothetical protein